MQRRTTHAPMKDLSIKLSGWQPIILMELQISQLIQSTGRNAVIAIDRKFMTRVTQLLQSLTQPQRSIFTCTCGVIKIDHLCDKRLVRARFLGHAPIRVDDRGASAAPLTDAVDAQEI